MPQPIQPLPAAEASLIGAANRKKVATTLSGVLPLTETRWFPRGNGYVPNASGQIEADSHMIPSGRERNFLRYVAGSVFTHCGDAWGFIGRAIDALLRGDLASAVHLVYYAELRATISLLASEGVFIGNQDHFALTAAGVQSFGRAGTHKFAWQALQAWAESPRALAVFSQVVRPGGETFSEWTTRLTSGAAQPKIDQLFSLMSIDLRAFDQDHLRRNVVSYNPSRLHPRDLAVVDTRDLVSDVWQSLDPGPTGAFPVLDNSLLPELLRSIFASNKRRGVSWEKWIDGITPTSQRETVLVNDLRTHGPKVTSTALVTALFSSRVTETSPTVYLRPMFARTVLLLRIATGSGIELLRESGNSMSSLGPWVNSLAVTRGLWVEGAPLDDPKDLWADVELALEEADTADVGSLNELLRDLPTGTLTFGQAERVPVWSFS